MYKHAMVKSGRLRRDMTYRQTQNLPITKQTKRDSESSNKASDSKEYISNKLSVSPHRLRNGAVAQFIHAFPLYKNMS